MTSDEGATATSEGTPDPATSVNRFGRWLAAMAALAAATRILGIFVIPRVGLNFGIGGDGGRYHLAALALADGHGYTNPFEGTPDVLHPPLWTSVLGVASFLGLRTPIQHALFASAIGVGTVVLIGIAGRTIHSERAGLVAAAIAAVYPGLWSYERNLNAETMAFPLIAAVLIVAYRYRSQSSTTQLAGLSALIALLALARAEQLLLIPTLLVPLVMGTSSATWARRVGHLALSAVIVVAVLAPWTIYNLGRFERPVFISAGAGNSMVVAYCDETFDGDLLGSYSMDCYFRAADLVGVDDRTVQDPEFRSIALDYALDHLSDLPRVVLAREGRTWSFFEPAQQSLMQGEQLGIPSGVISLQVLIFWGLLITAGFGIADLRRAGIVVYPLLAFPGIVVFTTMTAFGDLRYRAAAEIPIIIAASVAIALRTGHRRRHRSPASATAVH